MIFPLLTSDRLLYPSYPWCYSLLDNLVCQSPYSSSSLSFPPARHPPTTTTTAAAASSVARSASPSSLTRVTPDFDVWRWFRAKSWPNWWKISAALFFLFSFLHFYSSFFSFSFLLLFSLRFFSLSQFLLFSLFSSSSDCFFYSFRLRTFLPSFSSFLFPFLFITAFYLFLA